MSAGFEDAAHSVSSFPMVVLPVPGEPTMMKWLVESFIDVSGLNCCLIMKSTSACFVACRKREEEPLEEGGLGGAGGDRGIWGGVGRLRRPADRG